MKQKIESAIRETLVITNKQSISRAVEKILITTEQEQEITDVSVCKCKDKIGETKLLCCNAVLVDKWISVNDRLPENENPFSNDVVLFWSKKHGFWMIGCYDYEFSDWTRLPWEKGYKSLSFDDVTHWMPLPERPTDCD